MPDIVFFSPSNMIINCLHYQALQTNAMPLPPPMRAKRVGRTSRMSCMTSTLGSIAGITQNPTDTHGSQCLQYLLLIMASYYFQAALFTFPRLSLLTCMVLISTLGNKEGRYTYSYLTDEETEIQGIGTFPMAPNSVISTPEIRASHF